MEQKDDELASEKKNGVKRDKTIQGLTQHLKEKEKEVSLGFFAQAGMLFMIGFKTVDVNCQNCLNSVRRKSCSHHIVTPTCLWAYATQIAELCHTIEDRDDALAKAREAVHKAQLQKYQASILLFISF